MNDWLILKIELVALAIVIGCAAISGTAVWLMTSELGYPADNVHMESK